MNPNAEQRTPNHEPFYVMSKRRRTSIIIVCLLLSVFLIRLDRTFISRISRFDSSDRREAYDIECYHTRTFTVVNVVDGDTIDIDIPDGKYNHTRIRLWGIDTPETNGFDRLTTRSEEYGVMYFGLEAAEFTKQLCFGKPVTIYMDIPNRTRDKYERLLAYVQLPDDRFLNEVLVAEGFAYADLRFRHSFYNKYKQLEANARSMKKGLWKKVTHEQLPKWLQRERPNLLLNKKTMILK